MTGTSVVTTKNANNRPDRTVNRIRPNGRLVDGVMRKAHDLFAAKGSVPAHLASRTKRVTRTAERWLSGERDMKLQDFFLLASDIEYGVYFVETFMASLPEAVSTQWMEWHRKIAAATKAEFKRQAAEREAAQARLELTGHATRFGVLTDARASR